MCKVLSLGLWLACSCGIICSAESLASPGSLSCWALSCFVLFGDLGVPLTSVQGRSFPASLVEGASHVSSQGPDVVCCVSTFVLTCSQVTAWGLSLRVGPGENHSLLQHTPRVILSAETSVEEPSDHGCDVGGAEQGPGRSPVLALGPHSP